MKQLKYFSKGLVAGEYPKDELVSIQLAKSSNFGNLTSNAKKHNCFVTWKGPKLTRTHARSYQKFIDDNQDHNFIFFDDQSMSLWMQEFCEDREILKIYNNLKFSASKADIFRLAILYSYGGVYTSINRVFTTPISSVIASRKKFYISFERFSYIRKNTSSEIPIEFRNFSVVQHSIAAPSGHNALLTAMDEIKRTSHNYKGKKFKSVKEAIWEFTASLMLTRAVDRYLTSSTQKEYCFLGFEFNDSIQIPAGSEYRYAASPSYLGARNKAILANY